MNAHRWRVGRIDSKSSICDSKGSSEWSEKQLPISIDEPKPYLWDERDKQFDYQCTVVRATGRQAQSPSTKWECENVKKRRKKRAQLTVEARPKNIS